MADGQLGDGYAPRDRLTWASTFRLFPVALDPRKLALAAAGLLSMSLGWYLISHLFWAMGDSNPPKRDDVRFSNTEVKKTKGDLTEDQLRAAGDEEFRREADLYGTWAGLAGPGGRLRTLPWYEYRGPNPFVLLADTAGGSALEREEVAGRFLSGTVPVLVEPLVKLLLPVVKLFDPVASLGLRVYLLLCLVWAVAVWAFFGGVITRIAAVQLTGKDRATLPEAVKFVLARYTSYLLSPLVPVGLILVIVLCMMLYGLVALIPFLGDVVLYGLGLPLVLLGGAVLAVLLVGLLGYPLMTATISTEGTDTFDALSRSYNYVFQAPWTYAGRALAAVLYGAVVTFAVVFVASLAVYLGKWAVSQAPLSERTGRKPDYLFVYAPETFGWRQLLLKGSPAELVEPTATDPATGRRTYVPVERDGRRLYYVERYPDKAQAYYDGLLGTEKVGAGLATFWTTLVLLLVIGFSYSYFWSASTLIYLAMRQTVDETEPDEVYLDDDALDLPPPAAPGSTTAAGTTGTNVGATVATGPAAGGLSLPTTPAPAPEPVAPPVTHVATVSPTPAGPAAGSVPITPSVSAPPGSTVVTTSVSTSAPGTELLSPELGVPIRADGTVVRTESASVSPPGHTPTPPADGPQ